MVILCFVFFFQAEDGIRDLVRSRGLGDVYKRQAPADGHPVPQVDQVRLGEPVGLTPDPRPDAGPELSLIHI